MHGTNKLNWRAVPSSVIRKGDYKLIYYYEYENYKLFNLRDDVSEKEDLAQKMPEKAEQLRNELMSWVEATNAPVPTRPNSLHLFTAVFKNTDDCPLTNQPTDAGPSLSTPKGCSSDQETELLAALIQTLPSFRHP
jgi:hypothetical protein